MTIFIRGCKSGLRSNKLISISFTSTFQDFVKGFLEIEISEVGDDVSPTLTFEL